MAETNTSRMPVPAHANGNETNRVDPPGTDKPLDHPTQVTRSPSIDKTLCLRRALYAQHTNYLDSVQAYTSHLESRLQHYRDSTGNLEQRLAMQRSEIGQLQGQILVLHKERSANKKNVLVRWDDFERQIAKQRLEMEQLQRHIVILQGERDTYMNGARCVASNGMTRETRLQDGTCPSENESWMGKYIALSQSRGGYCQRIFEDVDMDRDGLSAELARSKSEGTQLSRLLEPLRTGNEVPQIQYRRLDGETGQVMGRSNTEGGGVQRVSAKRARIWESPAEPIVNSRSLDVGNGTLKAGQTNAGREKTEGAPLIDREKAVKRVAAARSRTPESSSERTISSGSTQTSEGSFSIDPTDADMIRLIGQNMSDLLPKVDFQTRLDGKGFYRALKENKHIVDYDEEIFVCFCQEPDIFGARDLPWCRGYNHTKTGPKGGKTQKNPYSWRPWAYHAVTCLYLKDPSRYQRSRTMKDVSLRVLPAHDSTVSEMLEQPLKPQAPSL